MALQFEILGRAPYYKYKDDMLSTIASSKVFGKTSFSNLARPAAGTINNQAFGHFKYYFNSYLSEFS